MKLADKDRLERLDVKPTSLLSRGKEPPHVTHRDLPSGGNTQLVPNLSLDGSWQKINPKLDSGMTTTTSPVGPGPTAAFQTVYHGQRSYDSQQNGESSSNVLHLGSRTTGS